MMRRLVGVAVVGLGLAACSDSTGPDGGGHFDAARVEAGVAAVERAGAAPAVQSFMALGGQLGTVGPGAAVSLPATGAGRLLGAIRTIAQATIPGGRALVPVIKPSVLGQTYVYDPATRTYVADPSRTDAPPDGVRFVLYTTDPSTGDPLPDSPIGYADLTDIAAGSGTSAGLSLVVVGNGITYLDYSFTLSGSVGNAAVQVEGYLSDGTERVNFDLETTGQLFGQGGTATIDATIEVPNHDFDVVVHATGPAGESEGTSEFQLVVSSGEDEIRVDATLTPTEVDATFTVNGALLATATGDREHPAIRGENGRELTPDEMAALGGIVEFADGVFRLLGDLLAPVGVLLLVALAL